MNRRGLLTCAAIAAAGGLAAVAMAQSLEDTFYIPLDHPAIGYNQVPPDDAVSRLEKKVATGQVKLAFDPQWGYLPALLKQLKINPDSQVLVFSRGSIQAEHISPRTPRAIYFNDEVALGYVQHGDQVEITALDPRNGIYFYSLDQEKADRPQFGHRQDCLRCHQGPVTLGVPGLMTSSVHPSTQAPGEEHGSAFSTDDRVPIAERWGGWYITGTTGTQTDLGNNTNLVDPLHPGPPMPDGTQNVTDLSKFFDTSKYIVPTSDLVALMTLEHQTRMTNLMTRMGWDARIALHDGGGKLDEAARQKLDGEIEQMVTYMLFANEAPLKTPVAGVSSFTKTFAELGPRDNQGRSLRDFDLHTRLFKYPLSYMIYSAAFDGLPQIVRDRVYQRLYDVLSGKDQSKAFTRLSAQDRQAVLEIVRDTKTNLPAYWKAAKQAAN